MLKLTSGIGESTRIGDITLIVLGVENDTVQIGLKTLCKVSPLHKEIHASVLTEHIRASAAHRDEADEA